MNEAILDKVKSVFKNVFRNPNLEVEPGDGAKDISGWDSLTHMTLINELEIFFQMTFTFEEVRDFKNVGDIVNLISKKLS